MNFGKKQYPGTATTIRRYTGLTAGHLIYSAQAGFGTGLTFEPAYYYGSSNDIGVDYYGMMAGYQEAADANGNASDPAFNLDIAYLLFRQPTAVDSLAPWTVDPDALLHGSDFLALGYASDHLAGEALAYVHHSTPYVVEAAPAVCFSTVYYLEHGMSGGPLYALSGGVQQVVAINVAGNLSPDPALSDEHVVTSDEVSLLLDAEYAHGLITGGFIHGKAKFHAGKTRTFTAGVIFADGQSSETTGQTAQYREVKLVATHPHKKFVTVTKVGDGSYKVSIAASAPSGTPLTLRFFRDNLPRSKQPALQTLVITVK